MAKAPHNTAMALHASLGFFAKLKNNMSSQALEMIKTLMGSSEPMGCLPPSITTTLSRFAMLNSFFRNSSMRDSMSVFSSRMPSTVSGAPAF